jgi:hypothetical protein
VEIVGVICFAGPAAEELFCGPPLPVHGGGEQDDYRMAYDHLRRQVGALRRGLEFERLRDSARRLLASPWARMRIPALAEALQRHGTLDGEQINDVLLG